jgi:hypothetical protein
VDLVQWIVAAEDGALRVGWAPAWADRLTSLGPETRPIRRRGAPLVSRWLPHPLAVGSVDGRGEGRSDPEARVVLAPGALSISFALALDGPDARPPLLPTADDVRFAGLYAELVRVIADLCEAAALPPTAIAPMPEHRGLDVALGAVGSFGLDALADSVILVRAAIELCAHARGLQLVDARIRCGTAHAPIDGRTRAFLAGAAAAPT